MANFVDPNFSFPEENFKTLKEQLGGSCLGRVPFIFDARQDIAPDVFQLDRLLVG